MKELKQFLKTANDHDPMRKNHVLVVIKPGFENLFEKLVSIFNENGYSIVKVKTTKLTLDQAKRLYITHKKENFYSNLCDYMCSGPTTAMILKKKSDNIFEEFAKLKDKIREDFGESDMRNVIHSSDSYKAFTHESQVYFYNINQYDVL